MTYLPQDTTRLTRRGADAALVSEALAHASSEISQAVRVHAEPPATLAEYRNDARQVERYLLDLAAEWLYEAQAPELLRTEILTEEPVDHLLVDPAALGEDLRVSDPRDRTQTWNELALAVNLAMARVAEMPEGFGLLEARQTFTVVRGTWLTLPRRPVAGVLGVEISGVAVADFGLKDDVLVREAGWGESVSVHYHAGYAKPRKEAPVAWRAEAASELRREWTRINAGGFQPLNISPTGFQLAAEQKEEDLDALLRRLGLDREPLDAGAREWLEEVRGGKRRLDIAPPATTAPRFVPRSRSPWVTRLYGKASS